MHQDHRLHFLRASGPQVLIELKKGALQTGLQMHNRIENDHLPTATGCALGGGFWGLLFGMIFFMPWLGMLVGAAAGGLSGKFADVGIDDNFINSVRENVTEGTSALFLLTSDAVMDKIQPQLANIEAEVIATNLSNEEESALQALFAHSE